MQAKPRTVILALAGVCDIVYNVVGIGIGHTMSYSLYDIGYVYAIR
jgi:hypothetical protein